MTESPENRDFVQMEFLRIDSKNYGAILAKKIIRLPKASGDEDTRDKLL